MAKQLFIIVNNTKEIDMSTLTQSKTNTSALLWTGLRILSGLLWLVFGLNGFLNFMPTPPPAPEAGAFLGAMAASGYFFPLVKISEVISGALLLSNKFTNFALVLLAPILVNIVLLHVFLDPAGTAMGAMLSAMHIALVYHKWDELKVIFKS